MEFQQYPSYKKFNDGVLNSLPQSWNNKPFWAVFKKSEITNKVNEQLLSVYLDRGVILYSDGGGLVHKPAESLEKYQLVHVDDFVMNNQQAWRGSVGISPYQGIVSPAYLIFKPNKELNPQFLKYQLRDKYFIDQFMISSLSVGTIQRQIKNHLLRAIQIPIPSQEEQQKIAAFLDTETTRIDNLISKQEKLIKLLEEQRKSIISHVVTKGLNPNVPMKDSGVDWLGDVPEHWKIGKIKRWFNTLSGGTPDSNNYVRYYKDGTHPWFLKVSLTFLSTLLIARDSNEYP
jgi:type I restriction enzyme, S subunit